ncbi:hypothetical protein [Treponema primitia]|uniref:hypothetical protein n=1 Tax=Treponema primitia TaxID=88058 RepID=UPI000255520B|nr:hypothetical protein [Treponema primitia]
MKKKYESELLMVCHEQAKDWHQAGIISDAEMREYDEDCLVHEPSSPSTAGSSKQNPSPAYARPQR